MLPTISMKLEGETAEHYIREMHRLDPRLEIREWPDIGNPGDVDIAMVWKMPHGELAKFPNLKLIISMAAGVDHVLSDPDRPEGVPIVRVTDPHMARSMGHWFLMKSPYLRSIHIGRILRFEFGPMCQLSLTQAAPQSRLPMP